MTADAALAIAHRAGNSLDGLHQANLLDVDVVECDARHRAASRCATSTAGPLPFLWGPLGAGVGARAPRLGLEGAPGGRPAARVFMLDLKGPSRSPPGGRWPTWCTSTLRVTGSSCAGGTGPRSSGSEQRPVRRPGAVGPHPW